jgi:hypothetical protein
MLQCTSYSQTAVYMYCVHCMKLDCTEVLSMCVIRPLCVGTCGIQTTGNKSYADSTLAISVGSICTCIHCTWPSVYMEQNCFCFVTELNTVLVAAVHLVCFSCA